MPFTAAPDTPDVPRFDMPHGIEAPGRRRSMLAALIDVGTLLVTLAGSLAIATIWMLARTGRGDSDLGTTDAIIGFALALAAAPAWTAWQWLALLEARRTFGAERLHLASAAPFEPLARAAWLVLHPVSLPFWAWAAAVCYFSGAAVLVVLSSLPLVLTGLVTLLTAASFVLLLAKPAARPLHSLLASALVSGRR